MGGQGAARPERVEQIGRVLRIGPGRQLDHHRAVGAVGVDQLAVDAEADQYGTAVPWDDPELIAVPAARQDEFVVGAREGLADVRFRAAGAVQPGPGDGRVSAGPAVVDEHLPEPGQVTRGGRDAAIVDGRTERVTGDLGVAFGAYRLPDEGRDEIRHPGAAGPLARPAQHVAVGRPVGELAAVRAGAAQRGQVRIRAYRVARPRRAPAHGPFHHADLGV